MESPLARHVATPADLQQRLLAERRGAPFLLYRDGAGEQHLLALEGRGRVTLGRRAGNDIALEWDHSVSRLHAVVEQVGGEWTAVDDGLSQNGTWVDGTRVAGRRRLQDGELLRLGQTLIAFCDPRANQSSATRRDAALPPPVELTATQRKVLIALCRPFAEEGGYPSPATNQDIANELYLSVDAIKTHLRTLFRKFAIADLPQNQKRLQLVERAMQSGAVGQRDLRR